MSLVLLKIINMSISAGILILAVILVRSLFRKIPRKIFIVAWILVMIRLVCPLSVTNPLSPVPGSFIGGNTTITGITDDSALPGSQTENKAEPADAGQPEPAAPALVLDTCKLVFVLWTAGIAVILAKAGIKTARLRKTVKDPVRYQENVYLCRGIKSSFILGIVRPGIYIPSSVGDEHLRYIIDHEKEHIQHRDHLIKLLFYVIVAVHWFNPLCHIAYHLFSEDLEMACDERTIDRRDAQYRANYMQTLLDCGLVSSAPGIEALSFGSIGIKRRVERIMDNKKAGKTAVAAFAIVCAALVFFLMTNNAAAADSSKDPENIDQTKYVTIRDSKGDIVEEYVVEVEGALMPPQIVTVSEDHADPQYDALAVIRDTVLREGVYRSSAKQGDPVFAVEEGKVISSGYESLYGYCVTVLDSEGRIWKYGHCSALAAKEGDSITAGSLIGYAGTSGLTTDPAVIIKIVK